MTPEGHPTKADDRELVAALEAVGTEHHLATLIDLVGGLAAHDCVTVTRYSIRTRPEFLTYRNFSDALVQRYLAAYYTHDPFYAYWCRNQALGVLPLSRFGSRALNRGPYVAEFLAQSLIRDEVGLLLDDGPATALGIFLERADGGFCGHEIGRLESAFPKIAAIHALHRRSVEADAVLARHVVERPALRSSRTIGKIPEQLWPSLTERERELVGLMLAGHPPRAIAARLGITAGTVRNHRLSIFRKLDITTEREVFLQYLDCLADDPRCPPT